MEQAWFDEVSCKMVKFSQIDIKQKYAAFVDILGFSSQLIENYDETLEQCERMLCTVGAVNEAIEQVDIRIYLILFFYSQMI